MGWTDRIRKSLNPAQSQQLEVATQAATQQMTGPAFAPGVPVRPYDGIGGQAKAWNIPAGYNIRSRPERDKRLSFEILKAMTDSYDVASMCIAHRINSIRSLPYAIVPEDDLEGNVKEAILIAQRAMKKPDGVHSFRTWLAMLIEDMLRYDAPALHKRRDRIGRSIALEVISGPTIAPVLDKYGRRPTGDAPAFVQYVQGQVWKWFKADDIIYEPFRPQADSPYGIAPIESVLLAVNTDLRFQQHFLNYFTEGTVPEGFIILPEEASQAPQMKEFQEVFDSYMYGDMAAKRQLKVLPGGSTLEFSKNPDFNSSFAEFLMRKVCAAFHVSPQELGFTMDVNRSTGDTQDDIRFRTGDLPVVNHIQDILTSYLQDDLGLPVKFQFDTGKEDEDKVQAAQADKIHIEAGVVSPDEIRELRYGLPTDANMRVPRFIMSPVGPIIVGQMLSEETDPETASSKKPLSGGAGLAPVAPLPAISGKPTPPAPHAQPGGAVPEGGRVALTQGAPTPPPAEALSKSAEAPRVLGGPPIAGAAIKAADTGRVLMIQRTLDPEDPAAGTWEFPGGHVEDLEHPQDGAQREWEEETGLSWPSDAELIGSWLTPDGVYAGYVYRIAQEASLPINTGNGEDGETLAWFDPQHLEGFPALRPELQADLPRDALAKGLRKEFSQWKSNTLSRLKRGQAPRRYRGAEFIPDVAVDAVYHALRKSQSQDDASSIFDTAMNAALEAAAVGQAAGGALPKAPSWRDAPPAPEPQHEVDLKLTDHYADKILVALREFLSPDAVQHVLETHVEVPVVEGIYASLREGANPEALSNVMDELIRDAYAAGDMAATVQLGGSEPLSIWNPGTPPEPLYADLGWEQALAQKGLRLRGISQTTIERIGEIIERGVEDGTSIYSLARDIDAYLGDYSRAEMIAHTETARMINLATERQYRINGIPQWKWIISAGACPRCAAKADKVFNLGDPTPPGHPRCRCAMSPVTTLMTI